MTRLGFLGPQGTFGEQAALGYDAGAELVPYASHSAVIAAVNAGEVQEAVVAVENSLEGAVNETLDSLLSTEAVFIRGELVLPVDHNLIVAPGMGFEDVDVVMSHPQALAQCRGYLEAHLPKARLDASLSTAAAVVEALSTPRAAGIGTRRAAELNGGVILASGIHDTKPNKTRFVVLGRDDAAPSGDDKTSIAFTVAHDRPGTLIGVLNELATRSINLTRIESRPSREELGIYVFLIDFHGHRDDPVVAEALATVRERAHYFRLFGSYPRFHEATG